MGITAYAGETVGLDGSRRGRGAILSECGRYRYYLQRTWHDSRGRLCFVMLNPSTADAIDDDATIRVCAGRAAYMGLGGVDVVNLFALRATNPDRLYEWPYRDANTPPVSESGDPDKNDHIIERVVRKAQTVICAWGKHGAHLQRDRLILSRLREWGIQPHALKLNKDGSPAHPLRIGYNQAPFKLEGSHYVNSNACAGSD